jgi:hypothetical protein
MTDRDESLPADVQRVLGGLPRELQPDPALEDRVVGALVASADIGTGAVVPRRGLRRRRWAWAAAAAAAAALVLAMVLPWSRPTHSTARGASYVLLLYEDASYRAPAPGHGAERVAEYGRWADSLRAAGELERAAALAGSGAITGFFIVRAESDEEAARLAAACPHTKYGGRVEARRLIE